MCSWFRVLVLVFLKWWCLIWKRKKKWDRTSLVRDMQLGHIRVSGITSRGNSRCIGPKLEEKSFLERKTVIGTEWRERRCEKSLRTTWARAYKTFWLLAYDKGIPQTGLKLGSDTTGFGFWNNRFTGSRMVKPLFGFLLQVLLDPCHWT